ncbi:MAG: hypothetical protein Q7Q71_08015 [Verrucomicrobiota bacterium JB023]|nr:hypothetical protein [Verrucomicrobiota bacterium JB023]
MKREPFPFVEIPEDELHVFGERIPDTRIYEKEGPEEEAGPWFEAVCAVAGSTVSPGGGSMFAPVSRPAVHKRIKEGNLTAFYFYITSTRKGLFGKQRKTRELPLVYIPTSELKAWGQELEERMLRLGKVSREELEEAKPDWPEEFWIRYEQGQRAVIYDVLKRLESFREEVSKRSSKYAILAYQTLHDGGRFDQVFLKDSKRMMGDLSDLLACQYTIIEVVEDGKVCTFSETNELKKQAIKALGPISRANALESEEALRVEMEKGGQK